VERGAEKGIVPPVSVIDGAVRVAGVVAEGEGYLSLRKDEPLFRRTGSRLVYDDLRDVIRFTAGDVIPFARSFQSTPTVAGISASRFYNILEPWREFRSTGSQSFTLFAPSMVETVVNGRSVERKLLQPGNYTLEDFPLAEGANDVRLLIQDEAGKQRTIEFNLYSNRQLLEPGATEFSTFAGVYSEPTRSGIDYSRHWAAFGFVRKGITQQFSAGVNVQADAKAQQVGGEVLFGTDLGLIGFDLAVSRRTDGGDGYAGAASFEKVVQQLSATRSMSLRAVVEVRSARFAAPGALVEREPLALRASAGWSLTLGRDTYVSADAQYYRDRVEKRSRYSARLSGGLSITETMSLIGDLEWEKSRERNRGIIRIGIRKRLGFRGTAQADVDSRGHVHTSYQNSNGIGIGSWSGSVDVDRTAGGTNLNAQGTLLTNRLELGLSQFGGYSEDGHKVSDMRTSLRAGTSIAFADGAFAIGRPIQQAFLIADPHRSLHGKTVRVDPQEKSEEARSGAFGGALDGTLSAYSPRTLIYDVPKAPPGYDLGAGNVQITPPYKAGYHLEVGSDYHLLVLGRLIGRDGEPISLLAGKAIDLKAPKRPAITMFTSRTGKFGAQGLRPGKWRIELPTEGGPTIYEIDIKDDPSGTVRLGDVHPVGRGSVQ
jgi:outer membrane usher protein